MLGQQREKLTGVQSSYSCISCIPPLCHAENSLSLALATSVPETHFRPCQSPQPRGCASCHLLSPCNFQAMEWAWRGCEAVARMSELCYPRASGVWASDWLSVSVPSFPWATISSISSGPIPHSGGGIYAALLWRQRKNKTEEIILSPPERHRDFLRCLENVLEVFQKLLCEQAWVHTALSPGARSEL